jgi:hypothetical protein
VPEQAYRSLLSRLGQLTQLVCDYHLCTAGDYLPAQPAWHHLQHLDIAVGRRRPRRRPRRR